MDLLGSTKGDGRNTWKGAVEASLTMHTSKFVRTRLTKGKEKEEQSTKKSRPAKTSKREKHRRDSLPSISEKAGEGDEKHNRLWDEMRALRS